MKSLNMRKGALFLLLTAIVAGTMPGNILAQKCGCAANECYFLLESQRVLTVLSFLILELRINLSP
ncbi:hypothetical protein SLEP1_g27891, partial [Rubroshorea leprosula]